MPNLLMYSTNTNLQSVGRKMHRFCSLPRKTDALSIRGTISPFRILSPSILFLISPGSLASSCHRNDPRAPLSVLSSCFESKELWPDIWTRWGRGSKSSLYYGIVGESSPLETKSPAHVGRNEKYDQKCIRPDEERERFRIREGWKYEGCSHRNKWLFTVLPRRISLEKGEINFGGLHPKKDSV